MPSKIASAWPAYGGRGEGQPRGAKPRGGAAGPGSQV